MLTRHDPNTLTCFDDRIELKKCGRKDLVIYPKWKSIESTTLGKPDLDRMYTDIKQAERTISKDCNQVYLIFPRNQNFTRHVKLIHEAIKQDEQILKQLKITTFNKTLL